MLITQAIHLLDLLLWAVGLPRRVAAVAGTSPVHRLEAEDTLGGLLDYGAGASVSLQVTTAAPPGAAERVTLVGSGGTAELVGSELTVRAADAPPVVVGEPAAAGGADPAAMPEYWHRCVLDDALRAFDAGATPLADGRSALGTQLVVEALYRAARTGRWVELAEVRGADRPACRAEGH